MKCKNCGHEIVRAVYPDYGHFNEGFVPSTDCQVKGCNCCSPVPVEDDCGVIQTKEIRLGDC